MNLICKFAIKKMEGLLFSHGNSKSLTFAVLVFIALVFITCFQSCINDSKKSIGISLNTPFGKWKEIDDPRNNNSVIVIDSSGAISYISNNKISKRKSIILGSTTDSLFVDNKIIYLNRKKNHLNQNIRGESSGFGVYKKQFVSIKNADDQYSVFYQVSKDTLLLENKTHKGIFIKI